MQKNISTGPTYQRLRTAGLEHIKANQINQRALLEFTVYTMKGFKQSHNHTCDKKANKKQNFSIKLNADNCFQKPGPASLVDKAVAS